VSTFQTAPFRRDFDAAQDPRTAANALKLQPGVHVQVWDAILDSLSGLSIVQGDLLYGTSANALTRLAKDTNATRYLSNTGTSNNPAWAQVNLANGVTGTAALANLQGHPTTTTDNVAVRFDGTAGFTQTSALVIADTTGAISRSGNGGIPVQGTNTNDSAASGDIGEFIESEILSGSAVSVTSGVAKDITSISLTAGDWDVWGTVTTSPAGGTTSSLIVGWISTTSATLPTNPNKGAEFGSSVSVPAGGAMTAPVGMRRLLLSTTTTTYLSCFISFAVSTMSAYGYIGARRRR